MASNTDMSAAASRRREIRREKILARGPDRLALISGRVSNISPESNVDRSTQSANITAAFAASPSSEEDTDSMMRGFNFNPFDARNGSSNTSEAEIEASGSAASDASQGPISWTNGTSCTTPASGTIQGLGSPTQRYRANSFSPKQISMAIEASRKTRVLFSVVVAAFVVLSHLRFPLLQRKVVKSIVNFRPLFLVLLTNLTNVAARALLDGSKNERSCRSQNGSGSQKEYGWPSQIELMLVLQKLINALVMDCSVYVVVLVCGLCFI